MKLYNTLTKEIENFVPLNKEKVKLFVCGPTVYDYAHIGNAKTYIQMDILARILRDAGYDVFYLQNITDIDDKIIQRATEKGVDWQELRTEYEIAYFTDMKSLQNTSVNQYARATDYIAQIIKQVQTLLDKRHAYKIDDGIYFEIATFKDYGKLSGRQEVKENDAQTRIDQSDQKRGWNDFCLWKFSKPGEPTWEAPFGKGRPGWHIEDTAITEHFFGPQYDIHGGAIDLIFPHHEAEITQMESISGLTPFVKYWSHAGFLNIENSKMSKSLNNFYTVKEVVNKGFDPLVLRLFMIQSHYRSTINFSWELLDAAQSRLAALRAFADLKWQNVHIDQNKLNRIQQASREALQNDLNTPQALSELSKFEEAVGEMNDSEVDHTHLSSFLRWLDNVYGLQLSDRPDLPEGQKETLAARKAARANKDWESSDKHRNELAIQGVGVRDTSQGQIWYRL